MFLPSPTRLLSRSTVIFGCLVRVSRGVITPTEEKKVLSRSTREVHTREHCDALQGVSAGYTRDRTIINTVSKITFTMSTAITPETEAEGTPMESIEPINLARAASSSLITDLELKVHPDSDVSRKFVYKMVTLEEDELFYEANDLDKDLARKLHRRVRRNNQGQVVAFTQTTVNTNLGEEQISTKKDDLKKMSKDDLVEHLQYQILHHHALSEQRNMLWVLLNKAEASRTLATLQLEELADDQGDLRHEHSRLRQEAASLRQRVRELEVRMRSARSPRRVTFDSTTDDPRRDERRDERRESLRHLPRERDDSNENHSRLTPFSAVSETREQHTMGIPKPPILTDGITPSFESWKFQMLNRFETNADHYSRPTRAAEEAAKIGYAVTRMEGKATDHFFPWMRAKRRARGGGHHRRHDEASGGCLG